MVALRRSARISKLDRKTSEYIRGKMDAQDTILHDITRKQLIWYGHVERTDPMRLPKIMINWKHERRKERVYPRRTWKDWIYIYIYIYIYICIYTYSHEWKRSQNGRTVQSKAMESGGRKASPDVLKLRNIYIYIYIYNSEVVILRRFHPFYRPRRPLGRVEV
jgi:hypothetical protein